MKKFIITFSIIILILLLTISVSIFENNKNIHNVKEYNQEYEIYLNKTIYGTDVMSIINRAINQNTRNNIKKNEKGFFIENSKNSIKVQLNLIYEQELVTYEMETLTNVGIEGFVKNFNTIQFKCVKIEYHELTQKVKKIVFEQIEE